MQYKQILGIVLLLETIDKSQSAWNIFHWGEIEGVEISLEERQKECNIFQIMPLFKFSAFAC